LSGDFLSVRLERYQIIGRREDGDPNSVEQLTSEVPGVTGHEAVGTGLKRRREDGRVIVIDEGDNSLNFSRLGIGAAIHITITRPE
jgi:hypothetical protein